MATALPLRADQGVDPLTDARSALADIGLDALADLLACLGRDPSILYDEPGRQALIEALICLVEALSTDRMAEVCAALADCAPLVASAARDLLIDALALQGQSDPASFDHPTILCLAALSTAAGRAMPNIAGTAARADPVKLVIWDLDDTLWQGTLAEGEEVALFAHRADLIRALNRHGILSSICSKNDPAIARAKLVELGLWDEFVFPHIAFEPKAAGIAQILADMQLRAANTLFIDDNPINLHEARFALPDLRVVDITQSDADATLTAILTDQPASRDRRADYRKLEEKHRDRRAAPTLSDEDFLRSCEIKACAVMQMANLDFIDRIVELVNRSNQLNYTASRIEAETLRRDILEGFVEYYSWSIFAEDRYGDHGLVGFVMIHRRALTIRHFVFSCRVMHMGVEAYALRAALDYAPDLIVPEAWRSRMGPLHVDWIENLPYEDFETRQALYARHVAGVSQAPAIRIGCGCQSGGIAHFSRYRTAMEFDIAPRLFALRDFADDRGLDAALPDYLVYGACIDYRDEVWPAPDYVLGWDLYRSCVLRLCQVMVDRGTQALVILPPENLADHQYTGVGSDRGRTIMFNEIWREALGEYPCLTLLEAQHVCSPADMIDMNHHRPAALQTISGYVDQWYAMVSEAAEQQSDASQAA